MRLARGAAHLATRGATHLAARFPQRALMAVLIAAAASPALAQDYPNKPCASLSPLRLAAATT